MQIMALNRRTRDPGLLCVYAEGRFGDPQGTLRACFGGHIYSFMKQESWFLDFQEKLRH